jgi:hypothetical protein
MIRASGYHQLWMCPRVAVARMQSLIRKHAYEKAASSGRFKQEREAWTASIYALGLSVMTGREYWVEIETVDQTPDVKVHQIDQSSGRNIISTQNVEIVDWDHHVGDVMCVIRQKCARAYPSHFCLLVLARNGTEINLESVLNEIGSIHVPFSEIWILGVPSPLNITMIRMVPDFLRLDFAVSEALKKTKSQREFLRRQKRGTSAKFRDLGTTYVPIP